MPTLLLSRDCDAIEIPAGHPIRMPKGTEVTLTQDLGGSYTIRASGGLFRIQGRDADALGRVRSGPCPEAEIGAADGFGEAEVWEALRSCYDPEIPVNIVDLGLIYDLRHQSLPAGGHKVFVKMTLTAPGCGMGSVIASDAQQKILALPAVEDAVVEVVWEPAWHPSMISPEGRRILGLE